MITWWGIMLDVVWRIHHSSACRFASVIRKDTKINHQPFSGMNFNILQFKDKVLC